MTDNEPSSPADYIVPLCMNGLQGRMLRMPAPANRRREILFVYGHHSSIERWWGIAQALNKYGAVTVPDLPGFGGMQSFYRIGEKPNLDTMADYLAAFVKLRYSRKRVTIMGMSYGFLVVTRMLQRYPELSRKVDLLFSAAGFAHYDDFKLGRARRRASTVLVRILKLRATSLFFRNILLHPVVIRSFYKYTANAKFADLSSERFKEMVRFEVHLWHCNDVRTHWATMLDMLRVDNCKVHIPLPVYHVAVSGDQYFDNHLVEQHMRVVFTDFTQATATLHAHAPSVIATAKEAAPLLPSKFRRLLARAPRR